MHSPSTPSKRHSSSDQFALNLDDGSLRIGNQRVRLEPKVVSVLAELARANGKVVKREDLIDAAWPNQDISDDVLTAVISSLRKALGDSHKAQRHIQTVPKRGYRLRSPIKISESTAVEVPPESASEALHKWSKRRLVVTAAVVTVLVSVGLSLFAFRSVPADDRAIAVLPFDVFGADASLRHFADGLAEELIHQLAADQSLKVISRTSAFQFRNSSESLESIGKKLNASMVIEGSVRSEGETIRVTVQLIDAGSGFHRWSETFDSSSNRILDLQSQIGLSVYHRLNGGQPESAHTTEQRHPVSELAFREYLLGRAAVREETVDGLVRGLDHYSRAVSLEPDYALAHLNIGLARLLLYQYRGDDFETAVRVAQAEIDSAFALMPDLADAHAVQGLLYTYTKDYESAEQSFQNAIALQRTLKLARHNFGYLLWRRGEFERALEHLKVAGEQDPLSGQIRYLVGDSLAGLGRFDEATRTFADCLAKIPDFVSCNLGMAATLRVTGRLPEADAQLAAARRSGSSRYIAETEAAVRIHQGRLEEAHRLLSANGPEFPDNYFQLKLRFVIAARQNELDSLTSELTDLLRARPNDDDVRLIGALANAFNGHCPEALALYDSLLDQDRLHKLDYWDVEFGIHHLSIYAACAKNSGVGFSRHKAALADAASALDRHDVKGGHVVATRIRSLLASKSDTTPTPLRLVAVGN